MSTDWTAIFSNTLNKYIQPYIEACGYPTTRAKILNDCKEEIMKSPLHNGQAIGLPEHLCWAICNEFQSYLVDDDYEEEKEKLVQLERGEEYLTPEQREAITKPVFAGEYWREFDACRAAGKLWAEEAAQADSEGRDRSDKNSIGKHAGIRKKWFNQLPRSKKEEAEKAAKKWNAEGASDKDRMSIYRSKNLAKRTAEFIDAIRRSMGVYTIVLHCYETPKSSDPMTVMIAETDASGRDRRPFLKSSKKHKTWHEEGATLLREYLASEDENSDNDVNEAEEDELPEVIVDPLGNPLLPAFRGTNMKAQQDVVRQIFHKAYAKITKRKEARVPWLELGKSPADYLDVNTIPEGFKVLDPSKMTKNMITLLWDHWSTRAKANQPILRFLKARESDLSGLQLAIAQERKRETNRLNKRVGYVDPESDDQSSNNGDSDGNDGTNSSEGMSRTYTKPPPSKRPRLRLSTTPTNSEASTPPISDAPTRPISECPTQPISENLASPNPEAQTSASPETPTSAIQAEEESPAANNTNREHFLENLSTEDSYKTLINGVLALSGSAFTGSSFLIPNTQLSLPAWVSWEWSQNYLPHDIHDSRDKLSAVLDSLRTYSFADWNDAPFIVLGFGLLLRECGRAIGVEDDDEDAPKFLQESILGIKQIRQVNKAIQEVIARLPSSNAGEKRLREKVLDDSAKVPSTSKTSQTQKSDSSPVKRSQRQRKPTQKIRESNQG